MGGFFKRAFAWCCFVVLAFVSTSALAEFSPRYSSLSSGKGITLNLSGKVATLSPLKKDALADFNDWFENLSITLTLGESPMLMVNEDGETLLSSQVQRKKNYTLTLFEPSGDAYLTLPENPDALLVLSGMEYGVPNVFSFPSAYANLAPQLYEKLESHVTPTKSKQKTSIKNAAASTSNEVYVFSGDDLNEFWTRIQDTLLPAIEDALKDQPALYTKAEELLDSLEFSGECKFKRFLNKDGEDMGLQFTGNATVGEDKRKITLFYGFTPNKGGYLSFSAPAVKGKNNLKITVSVSLTSKNSVNTFAVEGTYTRTLDSKTVSGTLNASLKNTIKNEDEKWTGKVTVSRTENKVKNTWTFTPSLTFTSEGLSGTVDSTKKQGDKTLVKTTWNVDVQPLQEGETTTAASAKDLRELSQEQARLVLESELNTLVERLAEWIQQLSDKEQKGVLGSLSTSAWMTGPMVPALEAAVEYTAQGEAWESISEAYTEEASQELESDQAEEQMEDAEPEESGGSMPEIEADE